MAPSSALKRIVPFSPREKVDIQVATYVGRLQDWIVGALHWSFASTRYFGKDGRTVKRNRIIELLSQIPLLDALWIPRWAWHKIQRACDDGKLET
ncbi:hypothetical protein DEU56DRAFT_841002 [Suillus clintonianus]|uniref:uncharacterized protein n=1 Tax=Suillus clintonianus TaxID=1904413 RepID=UPI001B860177|nr:uncharacterized protein DEU56DRAFT_841002 [Suillus clintonianus]KAG2115489.1 hypothetical protein DEU56DRAFT_841002 [Suillus clintonianus]